MFHPDLRLVGDPIEAHFGPLRQFTIANSNYPNHTVQTRSLHAYLRWRNANARHRDVLAAERKERARIRTEKGIRWGGRPSHKQPDQTRDAAGTASCLSAVPRFDWASRPGA